MSKGGGAPDAPDPVMVAGADAAFNRINQITPGGATTFGYVDADGNFVPSNEFQVRDSRGRVRATIPTATVRQEESPYQQAYREAAEGGALGLQDMILSGIGSTPGRASVSDFSGDAMRDAMYNKAMSLMQPNIDRQYARTEQTLSDRGIPIGSKAYSDTMRQVDDSTNEALSRMAWDAVSAGAQEQNRQYGLAADERRNALNEYAQLFNKSFLPTSTVGGQVGTSPIDVAGLYSQKYQGDLANYQAGQQANGNLMNMMGNMGAMALMASSKDVKTGKRPAPDMLEFVKEIPSESWVYKDDPSQTRRVGPYAEDFGAVVNGDPNQKTIDLGQMAGINFTALKQLAAEVDQLKRRAD